MPHTPDPPPLPPRPPRAVFIVLAVGVPVALAVLLIWTALSRPEPPTHSPGPAPDPAQIEAGHAVTLTIEATHAERWNYVDLASGRIFNVEPATWDLAFRRFNIIANGGPGFPGDAAVAALGEVPFDDVAAPPSAGWENTQAGSDSTNPAIARWYSYGFTSHLLTPLPHVWVVRTAQGRHVALRILGYYCPGPVPGCITIRYRFLD